MDKKGTRPSTATSTSRGDLSARKSLGAKKPSIMPPNTKDLSKTYNHHAKAEIKDAGVAKNNLNVSVTL